MNIVLIAPEIRLRGASLSLLGLVDELQKNHQVTVVLRQRYNPYVEELKKRHVKLLYCKYYLWVIHGESNTLKRVVVRAVHRIACLLNLLYAKKVARELVSCDVVHTNTTATNFGAYLSKEMGVPHVWHVREFGKADFGFMPVVPERKYYRFMEKHSDKIVLISKALEEQYKVYIPKRKMIVIYNGVDVEDYLQKGRRLFVKDNQIRVMMSGYISQAKGQRELVQAVALLDSKVRDHYTISIVGDGDVEYIRQVEEDIKAGSLQEIIRLEGYCNDMPSLLREIDISVICSRSEAFGRVTVEAMLAGTVLVGANAGGTPEILGGGQYGYLYEQGDPEKLSEVLAWIACHKDEAAQMAIRGQRYAEEMYTKKRNALQIEKLYRDIIR